MTTYAPPPSASSTAAWLLEVAIPFGAVAFLLGLATRMRAAEAPPAPAA